MVDGGARRIVRVVGVGVHASAVAASSAIIVNRERTMSAGR